MYLFLTQCFPSRLGGIESVVSNLAISIGKNNKVTVFADQHHKLNDAKYDNKYQGIVSTQRFGGIKFFRRRKKFKEIKSFIQSQKVDYIIADTWKSLELCIDYLNNNNIRVLCLAHGNELFSNNLSKKKRIISVLSKTTTIVANSNYTADLVEQLIGKNNKIKVIYPGANDLNYLEPDTSLIIKGHPVLLTLSRLDKRKGHALILRSIKQLKLKFPKIKYLVSGDGDQKSILHKLVDQYKIKDNVQFTGSVNEKQKKQLFDNTNIMVMPTLDESHNRSIEGFGISYLEAAFFSIPSIASNVGGTTEAVLHNETGIIIDNYEKLFDSLNDLLMNKKKIKRLGNNAKKRAELLFRWDTVVNKYLALLE